MSHASAKYGTKLACGFIDATGEELKLLQSVGPENESICSMQLAMSSSCCTVLAYKTNQIDTFMKK